MELVNMLYLKVGKSQIHGLFVCLVQIISVVSEQINRAVFFHEAKKVGR